MRSIDADALKNELSDKDYITYTHEYGDAIPVDWIMSAIDNAPTVELDESIIQAVLNKRCMTAVTNEYLVALHGKRPTGKWIPQTDYDGFTYWKCSECGKKNDYGVTDFCFRCGADMRKEVEND